MAAAVRCSGGCEPAVSTGLPEGTLSARGKRVAVGRRYRDGRADDRRLPVRCDPLRILGRARFCPAVPLPRLSAAERQRLARLMDWIIPFKFAGDQRTHVEVLDSPRCVPNTDHASGAAFGAGPPAGSASLSTAGSPEDAPDFPGAPLAGYWVMT